MRIGDITIPDVEVEKLAKCQQKLFYPLANNYPFAITGWSLTLACGSGRAQRVREVNDWLYKYGLKIGREHLGKTTWIFWIQPIDKLNIRPKEVVGETA